MIKRFFAEEEGQTLVEYGLSIGFVLTQAETVQPFATEVADQKMIQCEFRCGASWLDFEWSCFVLHNSYFHRVTQPAILRDGAGNPEGRFQLQTAFGNIPWHLGIKYENSAALVFANPASK